MPASLSPTTLLPMAVLRRLKRSVKCIVKELPLTCLPASPPPLPPAPLPPQGWYAECNSRAEDAVRREKEEYMRAKAAEELAAAGDMLILEMEAKFSEMRMKLAA